MQAIVKLVFCCIYLLQALALKVLALNLVVQVVDIRPMVLSPVNLECVLRKIEHDIDASVRTKVYVLKAAEHKPLGIRSAAAGSPWTYEAPGRPTTSEATRETTVTSMVFEVNDEHEAGNSL